jgi:hypothetical protein
MWRGVALRDVVWCDGVTTQDLCVGTFVLDGVVVNREWANFEDVSFDSAWQCDALWCGCGGVAAVVS